MNGRILDLLKTPIDSIVLVSMQNDGHRGSNVCHPRGKRLRRAEREATDSDRPAPGAAMRFTIFPVADSIQVHNVYSMVAPAGSWGWRYRTGDVFGGALVPPGRLRKRSLKAPDTDHLTEEGK